MVSFYRIDTPSQSQLIQIENFVKTRTNQSYFQSTLFFRACKTTPFVTPVYFLAYTNEQLVGVLLVFRQIQYRLFPLSVLSSRTIVWGGPLVKDEDVRIYRGLYEIYLRKKPFSIYTQVRNLFNQSKFRQVMQPLGFAFEEHLNILVDLEKTEEQLWQEIHSKRRNEIRRAIKEGTTFEKSNDTTTLKQCYSILTQVYQRAKLPLPKIGHFNALLQTSNEKEGLMLFVAKFEGRIIGCMLCLAYGNTLFDYYAGAYSENYHKYPNDLIPWEVFKWGKQNGFTRFDFGGAGKPNMPYGVREYKKKFGGEMVNYGRFEKIHFPALFRVALLAFRFWKFLKK